MPVTSRSSLVLYGPDDDALDAVYAAMHEAAREHEVNVNVIEHGREDADR